MDSSVDVYLINPPMADIVRPSIALGILSSLLARSGIVTRSTNANMLLAARLGLDDWNQMSRLAHRPNIAATEWLFAPAALPDRPCVDRGYLDYLFEHGRALLAGTPAEAEARLYRWRDVITSYVNEMAEIAVASGARIVGCTSTFAQHLPALAILRRIRELAPNIVTMLGGANCEGIMGQTTHRNFDWVDYVVSGEAEEIIEPLCLLALRKGRSVPADELPKAVFGPVHRIEQSYPLSPPRAAVQDLRSVPGPNYDDFYAELAVMPFKERVSPGLPLESSRGCWWGAKSHCTFCGLNGGTMEYRAKPAEQVLAEMETLAAKHETNRIEFVDNIFHVKYFDTLLPLLQSKDYNIFYEFKANLRRDQVEMLSRSGIRWIQPGIESLDSRILKLMRKGIGAWRNVQLLKWARQYGIRVSWGVIWDFPGEQDSWYAAAASLLPHLRHLQPGSMFPLRYDRFSPYHQNPAAFGITLQPASAYGLALGLPNEILSDFVYYFERTDRAAWAGPGPGVRAFNEGMDAWAAAWKQGALPVCTLLGNPSEGQVIDTRGGTQIVHSLSRTELAVLQAADDAPMVGRIAQAIGDGFDSGSGLDDALSSLKERGLVVEIDDRLVSLVLSAPVTHLPSVASFPGGWLEPEPIAARQSELA